MTKLTDRKLAEKGKTDHCQKCGYVSYPIDNGGGCPNCGSEIKAKGADLDG